MLGKIDLQNKMLLFPYIMGENDGLSKMHWLLGYNY